jgi:hypothetical protein
MPLKANGLLMPMEDAVHVLCRDRNRKHLFDSSTSSNDSLGGFDDKGGTWHDPIAYYALKSGEGNGCVTDESGTRRTRLGST